MSLFMPLHGSKILIGKYRSFWCIVVSGLSAVSSLDMKRGDKRFYIVLFLTEQNINKVPELTEVYSLIPKNNKFSFSFIILRLRFSSKGTTVEPLLNGHPQDFENCPLNRGWPFNRGIKYCSQEILN